MTFQDSILPKDSRIFVAGHRGMVGSALMRRLRAEGYTRIATRTHAEIDLTDQRAVVEFFDQETIEAVFLAAARVGGIHANNTYRAEFIYQNLMIACNVIHSAYRAGVQRLLFLGSSCIYPRHCPQPMREEFLLSGYLEQTNEPYAVAKISGIKLCESYNRQYGTRFRCVMPTNLYGPYDNFDLDNSHVLAALLRKFHLAKLAFEKDWKSIQRDEERFGPIPKTVRAGWERGSGPATRPVVTLWGTGYPRREFLHVDDMAAACLYVMQAPDDLYEAACSRPDERVVSHLNIGWGKDLLIRELAGLIQNIVGCRGDVQWDSSRPDGMPQKLLDISRLMQMGWHPQIDLKEGIRSTYQWYCQETGFPH